MCLSATLLPLPEKPMITVVWPAGMSSVIPSSTTLGPKALWTSVKRIMGGSQQHQRPEGVEHQDRLAADHHRAGGVAAHPFGAPAGGEAHQAAGQGHGDAEARRLEQAEPDVLEAVEEAQPLHELEGGEVEQVDGGDP